MLRSARAAYEDLVHRFTNESALVQVEANRYQVLDNGILLEFDGVVVSPLLGWVFVYVTSTTTCGSAICPRMWRLTFRRADGIELSLVNRESLFVS